MRFQFYAREKNVFNFQNKILCAKDFVKIGDKYYTPFSGLFQTKDQARAFLNENGEFWKARGVNLELFEIPSKSHAENKEDLVK